MTPLRPTNRGFVFSADFVDFHIRKIDGAEDGRKFLNVHWNEGGIMASVSVCCTAPLNKLTRPNTDLVFARQVAVEIFSDSCL